MRSARQPLRSFNVYPNLTSRGATFGFADLAPGAETVRYATNQATTSPQFDFHALRSPDRGYCTERFTGRVFGTPKALWQHQIPISFFDAAIPFYRQLVGPMGLEAPLYLSLSEPGADAVQEVASAIELPRSYFQSELLGYVCFSGATTQGQRPASYRASSQVNGDVLMVPTAFNSYAAKGRSITPAAQTYSWQSCVGRLSTACSVLTTNFNAYPDISVYLNNVQANPQRDFPGMYRRFILYTPQPERP